MRRTLSALLTVTLLAAAGPARAENPVQFFERLLGPPAHTMKKALNPRPPARKSPTHKTAEPEPEKTGTDEPAKPAAATPEKPTEMPPVAKPDKPPAEKTGDKAGERTGRKAAEKQADAEPGKSAATSDLLSVPMPRLRPGDNGDAGGTVLGYAPATGIEAAPLSPRALPPPKPGTRPSRPLKLPPPAARSTCGAVIADLGVQATPLEPVVEGACTIPAPVTVKALDDGAVAFTAKALLNCSLAEALASWMKYTVQPIAAKTLGARVTGLRIAASYSCRNRDNLPDTKLSEHARGNAIDISAFEVDGMGWIDVENGWTGGGDKADFLRKVRKSACGPFTTVLGPGSDKFHTNHFHLDRAKRRTAGPSRGLFCH